MAVALYGMSLRSINQAKTKPKGTAMATVIAAKISVVTITR